MHEPDHVQSNHPLPSERAFGVLFTVIPSLAAVYFYLQQQHSVALFLMGLAAVVLLTTWLAPLWLRPLNRLWMKFGELLGRIVSPVVLGILFITVFTLPALGMRLAGRDILGRKPSRQRSFWQTRPVDQRTTTFTEQY